MEGIDSSAPACVSSLSLSPADVCFLLKLTSRLMIPAGLSISYSSGLWGAGKTAAIKQQKHASSRPDKEDVTVMLHPHCPVPLHLSAILGGGHVLRTGSEAGTGGCCSWGETWSKCPFHRNIKSPGKRLGRKSVQTIGLTWKYRVAGERMEVCRGPWVSV